MVKHFLHEKAIDLFNRMDDEFNCKPTIRSFNSILNVIVQVGQFEKALNFYESAVECWNMMPNVLTFNLMNWISLSSNKLSGVIPSWIGKLTNLTILKLSNNSFYGEISPEMKQPWKESRKRRGKREEEETNHG